MDQMLSIGKVADIMGVTVQTLRYYDSIGLLAPAYSNPETNYRYYSIEQLHFIDRIKYLQRFGISLDEIKTILVDNDIALLLSALDEQKTKCRQEIEDLQDKIDDMEWYQQYFTYVETREARPNYYSHHRDSRYLLAVKIKQDESRGAFHVRLNQLKSKTKDLPIRRQFFYLLDYDSFAKGKLKPLYLGLYLKTASFDQEVWKRGAFQGGENKIVEIPEGEYFSFQAKILSGQWDASFVNLFFKGKSEPRFVVASEYENSLCDYSDCTYEVEIPIAGN